MTKQRRISKVEMNRPFRWKPFRRLRKGEINSMTLFGSVMYAMILVSFMKEYIIYPSLLSHLLCMLALIISCLIMRKIMLNLGSKDRKQRIIAGLYYAYLMVYTILKKLIEM